MQIYLARDNVQAGPYSLKQLNTMLASGEVELTDLAWHDGMQQWQPLSELTGGQYAYYPAGYQAPNQNSVQNQNSSQGNVGRSNAGNSKEPKVIVIDARSKNKKDSKPKRLSVDELYGRKPVSKDTDQNNTSDDNKTDKPIIRIELSNHPLKVSDDILAGVSVRVLATLIDWLILALIYMPSLLRINLKEVPTSGSVEEAFKHAQAMAESIPEHIMLMTSLFVLAYLFIQSVLLVRRGQSIGKLLTGIRILDFQSQQLAPAGRVILLRSMLTMIVYSLSFPLFVAIDYTYMIFNRNNRSLHDKLAGTIVVKADDSQLATDLDTDKVKK